MVKSLKGETDASDQGDRCHWIHHRWSRLGLGRHQQAYTPTQGQVTFSGTIAEWQYPGSKRVGDANMSDGGNPLLQSMKCKAILSTADPVEKVVEFYSKKLGILPAPGAAGRQGGEKECRREVGLHPRRFSRTPGRAPGHCRE